MIFAILGGRTIPLFLIKETSYNNTIAGLAFLIGDCWEKVEFSFDGEDLKGILCIWNVLL